MSQQSIDPATARWTVADTRPGQRRTRLFLLPHAGGGANTYRLWPAMMPSDLDVRPVQLPGRERRFSEPPIDRMDALLDVLVPALRPLLDLPFALFGHSMGSCIAHALALRLSDLGLPPFLLIASGREAPHLPRRKPSLHTLAEPEFLEALRRLNGTPPEVLQNRELLDLVLPMLRADFTLVGEYRPAPTPRLSCPIMVLGGETDAETTPEGLAAWSDCTTGPSRVAMLPGGHFFTDTARAQVVARATEALHQFRRDG
jgi:surfactin synthase thioesterase subunit